MAHIAVVGAGIVGITTTYSLLKRGFRVTAFERHRYPAMETSFANGGQLSASNAEVWNRASTIAHALTWMFRQDARRFCLTQARLGESILGSRSSSQKSEITKETLRRAGVESRDLAASLGERINIYPVKGYSIMVHLDSLSSRDDAPRVSILDDEKKVVTSRLGDRFRVAGTAEFNGYNRDIRADRIRLLVDWTREHFPAVDTDRVMPWSGLRRMTPSMMPRVGKGRRPNVYYNTGHGHLGWTMAAATSELIADIVAADQSHLADMTSY
jgi:D-amino-acid dehydrogenase